MTQDLLGERYRVRAVEEGDTAATLQLLRLTVGETSASGKTEPFWRWKHSENPFGRSYLVGAWDRQSSQLVGLRALMHWSLQGLDGTPHRAARPVDTATHPDHQRRGIFSNLTKRAIEDLRRQGASFIFNTPNANSLPGYLRLGWKLVDRCPLYARPSNWIATAGKWLARSTAISATEYSRARTVGFPTWQEFRARSQEELTEVLIENENQRRRVGYRTVRNLCFLDWRYGSHPAAEYRVHTMSDDGRLAGVAVTRSTTGTRGLKALLVTEMLLRQPSADSGARLLRSLLAATPADYVLAHFAVGTIEHEALTRTGFCRVPRRGSTLVGYPLSASPQDPTQPESWDLTLGELEIF